MSVHGIKINNRNNIYKYIQDNRMVTKNEIVLELDLSLPTVNQNMNYFLKEGLILKGQKVVDESKSGRNPIAYTYVADACYSVGLDITKNHLKGLILNLDGEIIKYRYKQKKYERTDEYMKYLGDFAKGLIDEARIDKNKILGVGIAVPGLINIKTQTVIYGKVIDNMDMQVSDFSKYIPYDAKLLHDSNASGFAEFWFEKNLKNAFYISLCNSVGGAALIGGNIYTGDGDYSAEIGHMKIGREGKICYCGQKDCMDTYCSASILSQHSDYFLPDFFMGLEEKNDKFERIWDEYLEYLAIAIHNVRILYGCRIILGGDVGAFLNDWMERLCDKVDKLAFLNEKSRDYLYQCTYKKEAVATGAALYYIEKFRNNPSTKMRSKSIKRCDIDS